MKKATPKMSPAAAKSHAVAKSPVGKAMAKAPVSQPKQSKKPNGFFG